MPKKCVYIIVVFLATSLSTHYLFAEEAPRPLSTKETRIELAPVRMTSEQQKIERATERAPSKAQPVITFDTRHYNAGEVWEGEIVSHTFTVKNTGTSELTIKSVKPG